MKDRLCTHPWAVAITGLFVALAATYSLVSPIFEVSDEFLHYPVVEHIATTGQLPVQDPDIRTMWDQEGSQPPLYYLLGAGLTFWIDTSDLEAVRWLNPHAKLGIPLDPDNKNIIIHTAAERFPWRGTVLAVHLIRFLSVIMGAVSVALAYAIAYEAWPGSRWLPPLAAALVAFNPMFLFISGSVNNDNLMVLLGTWTLLLLVRVLRDGLSTQRSITLAVVVALGSLTKISGLTFAPVVGLALAVHGWRTRRWREAVAAGGLILIAWATLAGWWYLRNLRLYGELLGTQTMIAIAGGRPETDLAGLVREWYGFWVAYWALFGGVSILADPVVYRFLSAISWAAAAGLIGWGVVTARRRAWQELMIPGLLAVQVILTFAALIRWTLMTYGSQGRLMFPAIGAISALMALGLLNWLPERWQQAGAAAVGLPLLAIAVISPFRYIAPAYADPPVVDQIPAGAVPAGLSFNGFEIVAVATESVTVEEGGRVPITLYMRANGPLDTNYSLYLHALGRNGEEIGKIDTYPGGGALPASHMQPGAIYADHYSLELEPEFETPTIVRVAVGAGLRTNNQYIILNGRMPDGSEIPSVVVHAGVAYPADESRCVGLAPADAAVNATVGGFARLWAAPLNVTASPGESVPITLYWDRLADTPVDWTVFVHLVGADDGIAAQADGPPLNGAYPTSLWRRACQFADVHTLQLPGDIPAGTYRVIAGMYNAADPAYVRAPATTLDGTPYPDYAIPLGTVHVEAP